MARKKRQAKQSPSQSPADVAADESTGSPNTAQPETINLTDSASNDDSAAKHDGTNSDAKKQPDTAQATSAQESKAAEPEANNNDGNKAGQSPKVTQVVRKRSGIGLFMGVLVASLIFAGLVTTPGIVLTGAFMAQSLAISALAGLFIGALIQAAVDAPAHRRVVVAHQHGAGNGPSVTVIRKPRPSLFGFRPAPTVVVQPKPPVGGVKVIHTGGATLHTAPKAFTPMHTAAQTTRVHTTTTPSAPHAEHRPAVHTSIRHR